MSSPGMFWELLLLLVDVNAPTIGVWMGFVFLKYPEMNHLSVYFFIRILAKDELVALLQQCAETLQSAKSKKMKNALVQLQELLTNFRQMDGKQRQ